MKLLHWPDAAVFLERAEGFLAADEARHHLSFGIAMALRERNSLHVSADQPFFATIEAGGTVVATALRTSVNLILSSKAGIDLVGISVLDALADVVFSVFPELPGALGPPVTVRSFADTWTRQTGQPGHVSMRERSHELRAVRPLSVPPGRLRLATTADRAQIVPWLTGMHTEIGLAEPFDAEAVANRRLAPPEAPGDPYRSLYLWVDDTGEPRSMAGAQATTATGVRIGAVYTPAEHRRQGYATAAVASLSQAMLDRGRRACYLFTDLANPTSNHIYAEIGFEPVCDLDEIRFS